MQAKDSVSRAALYSRISIDREESISIDSQVAVARDMCAARGWSLAEDAIFVDRGFSGKNTRRPSFQQMMARVKNREFDVVLVYKLDRASRSVSDLFATIETLERHGCAFVSATQPLDTSTPIGKMMVAMLAAVAQFEREMIAERTRDALANKAKGGEWAGGRAPYGYRLAPSQSGKVRSDGLILDPVESPWALEVFRRHLAGESVRAITLAMIAAGAPPPRGSRGTWSTHTVFAVVKNPVYAGLVQRKHSNAPTVLAEGRHEALVSREEWLRALERFVPGRRFRDAQKLTSLLPFSLLRCARCGGGCTRKETWVKSAALGRARYRYYRCQASDREKTCDALSVRVEDVDSFVLDRLADLTRDPALLDARIRKAGSFAFRERDKLRGERASLERAVGKLQRDLEILVGRLTDSTVATTYIEARLAEINAQITAHQGRIDELGAQDRQLEGVVIDVTFVRAALVQLEGAIRTGSLPTDELALLIRTIVERVEIEPGADPKLFLRGQAGDFGQAPLLERKCALASRSEAKTNATPTIPI